MACNSVYSVQLNLIKLWLWLTNLYKKHSNKYPDKKKNAYENITKPSDNFQSENKQQSNGNRVGFALKSVPLNV